jgi:hypothetical protein
MFKFKTKVLLLQTYVCKSVLLTILILFVSCNRKELIRQKPFIIVGKNSTYYSSSNRAEYYYQDAKGNNYDFTDFNNKYNVGDTIR